MPENSFVGESFVNRPFQKVTKTTNSIQVSHDLITDKKSEGLKTQDYYNNDLECNPKLCGRISAYL